MPNLIDILTFKAQRETDRSADGDTEAQKMRADERDAAVLADKYPPDAADIETISEYRLASLLQYPHY